MKSPLVILLPKDGSRAYVERMTPLEDDIALHCGRLENSKQVIEETINLLTTMNESNKRIEAVTGIPEPVNYEPRIVAFKSYLATMQENKSK